MSDARVTSLNTIIALGILLAGLGIAALLWATASGADETPPSQSAPLVNVIEAQKESLSPLIDTHGTVIPARQITIEPQVEGRIDARHPGLVSGGVVQADEVLLEIDSQDYELALQQAETDVALAKAELELEEGRQVVAQEEWQRFGSSDEEPPPLALREPQQLMATLEIERAQQALYQAELEMDRTQLRAPFTALVREADVEPGEIVTPSSQVATLAALDSFWVMVSLPVEEVARLAIPGRDGDVGSRAFVHYDSGTETIEHQGRIIRLLGDLDPAARTARVIVEIENPFALSSGEAPDDADPDRPPLQDAPLLLGSFVSVQLEGHQDLPVIELPRSALHDGQHIYVATDDDTLAIREVQIAWRHSDTIAVSDGISAGDRIITSALPAPIEGMPLRVEPTAVIRGQSDPRRQPDVAPTEPIEPTPDDDDLLEHPHLEDESTDLDALEELHDLDDEHSSDDEEQ